MVNINENEVWNFENFSETKCFSDTVVKLLGRIDEFKGRVREFYYDLILSMYRCPACDGKLIMNEPSQAKCKSCGHLLDPTLAFQLSSCCGSNLKLRYVHYDCSKCGKTVPSKFLFDERIFNKMYFREMMQVSRARAKKRKEEIRRLMVLSRSEALSLTEEPQLETVPGLIEALDKFIQPSDKPLFDFMRKSKQCFRMSEYRNHMQQILGWDKLLFSSITPLQEDYRKDRAWLFITLVFMRHSREVELTQNGNDIWISKVYNEAYS